MSSADFAHNSWDRDCPLSSWLHYRRVTLRACGLNLVSEAVNFTFYFWKEKKGENEFLSTPENSSPDRKGRYSLWRTLQKKNPCAHLSLFPVFRPERKDEEENWENDKGKKEGWKLKMSFLRWNIGRKDGERRPERKSHSSSIYPLLFSFLLPFPIFEEGGVRKKGKGERELCVGN